jgi:alpha-glucosidase (family GH31 glycosyl hydrolase)
MKNYQDFTIDKKNFVDLPDFIDYLHLNDKNLHYIPIIDAGIAQR